MAKSDFVFFWDEENQIWVADLSTQDRRRKTQSLPIDAETLIDGARRERKGNRDILYIPKSKKEQVYKAFPDFKPEQDVVEKTIRKGAQKVGDVLAEGAAGAAADTGATQPSSVGLGERIGKSFKSEKVEIGAPLPGSNRPKPETLATTTTVSGYGTPLTTQGRTVPVAKYIENVDDYATIETTGVRGVFNAGDVGEDVIFIAEPGKSTSTALSLNQFTNNIWGLSPAQVTEFKKAIGYKDTSGVASSDFADALIKKILPVSEANYRNAMNNKPSASWQELVINPTKYTQYVGSSLAGGGAGAVSAQDIKVKSDAVKIYATDLGIGLDDATANKLAREWAAGNYDATTIKPQIARSGKIDFNKGSASEQLKTLKELAGSYGMQFDEGWFNTAATNILTAKDDVDTYKEYIRDQAKSKFPTLSAQLDQGFTVRQLASPYLQTMSNILEIDANTIGLNDVYINQALTGLNDKGEPSTKPLWQFEQDLRKDPRWNYTKNAQDSLMGTARKVLQDFGLVS